MYFAENMKFLRKKKGYTQDEVARLLGVGQREFSNWELGFREPRIKTIIKIARLYSVTIDDLILTEMAPQKPLYIKNLIFLRNERGLTQDEVAQHLGFKGKGSISSIECCVSEISVENLIKLADFYEISLDELVKSDLAAGGDD